MGIERAGLARACALLGTAAFAAAGLCALWSRTSAAAGEPRRALLVDLSHSVRARYRDPGARLAPLVRDEPGSCVIAYGAEVARCRASELRGLAATLDGSASELDAALETARAALGDSGERRIAILGDGGFSGADPRPRLAALAAEGVGIEWLALPGRERAEFVLGEPRAGEARVGAPLALELPLSAAPCGTDTEPRTLEVEVEHAGASTRSAQALAIPAGLAPDAQGFVAWSQRFELGPLAPGETRVRFRLAGAPGAARELALVPEGSRPRAAVLGPLAGLADAAGGPEWIATDAARLARELESFDLVLTTDTSLEALPRAALADWIARGGAWIACAAPANFPHEWNARSAAELLPLAPAGEGLPPRDVVFLLDGSGSMVGAPWNTARAALGSLAAAASSSERLFVRSFAGALGPAEALGPGVPAAGASGGPTALCDALAALTREPSERERLVVLLTDGKDRGGADALARAPALADELVSARITLAAIAIGEDANLELLRALSNRRAELLVCASLASAPDAEALAALFRRELGARQWARELAGLQPADTAPAGLGAALAELRPQRPLARCAALAERGSPAVALRTPKGTPALALARLGLGWTVAAGFDPAQGAFAPWNTLAGFVARTPAARRPRIVLAPGELRVENVQPGPAGWLRAELRAGSERAELALRACAGGVQTELAPALEARAFDALVLRPGTPDELALALPPRLAPEERLPRPALEPAERAGSPARAAARPAAEGGLFFGLLGLGLAASFLAAALGFFSRAGTRA